jgi:hypothetical protein
MLTFVFAFAAALQSGGWTSYDAADAKLTASYQALIAHLSGEGAARARNDERSWIAQRNHACGIEAKNDCAARWERARAQQLDGALSRTVTYKTMDDAALLRLEAKLDDACRSPGQDADGAVCKRRDEVFNLLGRRGYCWGPTDAASESEMHWMRAGTRCQISVDTHD